MNVKLRQTMRQSAQDFQAIVAPKILPLLGGGELVRVESVVSEGFVKDLDILAGIDAWHLIRNQNQQAMRGIASRIQWRVVNGEVRWQGREWRTFSVRTRIANGGLTEFDKRLRAIEEHDRGWLYPHLTCQAYLDEPGGQLISAAVAKTADIIWAIGYGLVVKNGDGTTERSFGDGTWFKAVRWEDLHEAGKHITVVEGVEAPYKERDL